ncbi:MAG: PDZ domain-containing protein [Methylophilaceae bacterium]|jgi:membrane-associated protease RseP (regulator of RpoE activity)|nr:PDZ domain-containing protein [Methylophilaceae bacterium]
MMKKMLYVALVTFCIQTVLAAENLYEKNYKEQNNSNLKSMQANPDTKMYVSNHFDDDNISMLESSYDMMGSSGFEAGSIAPDLALEHAKSIKADVVLVYSKYASKKSSLSTLQTIKEAAKTTGEIDEDVLKGDEEQYKYYASYWAKLPLPLLGLHVIKLKHRAKDSNEVIEDDGLKVLAVIKGSSAAKAGLKRGDVLLKIAGVEIQTPAQLSQAVGKNKGKEVKISYERNDNLVETSAKLIAQ